MSNFYPATGLTGGAAGALDAIDGADLADGDVAIVGLIGHATYGNAFMAYVLDADSAASESSPSIITPDTNAGDKRWVMLGSVSAASLALGEAQAGLPAVSKASAGAISAAECRGQVIYVSGAGTYTLPAVSGVITGGLITVSVIGAITVSLDPDAADRIILNGVALDDGDKITSDGAAGATVTLHKDSANGWTVIGGSIGWIDGGA
jgi:hypothetical protein